MEEFRELMRAKYKDIKETYKHYASLSPAGEVWSISQNVFTDFTIKSGIVDYNLFQLKEADVIFY